MSEEAKKKQNSLKSQFSAEAIAAGGGIIGLLTLALLIYQNYLMSDQTAEMIATNKEMIQQRKIQEKERFNHLIEILYDSKEDKPAYKTSYRREVKEARYNSKLRTEAFHEMLDYLQRENRSLDLSGGLLGFEIDFRSMDYSNINCSGADLRDAKLNGAKLENSIFHNADFFGADLSKSKLSNSDLSQTILYKANLQEAILTKANLRGAILRQTNLTKANLQEADLRGAKFIDVDLSDVDLKGVIYNRNTSWPENFDLVSTDLKYSMKLMD